MGYYDGDITLLGGLFYFIFSGYNFQFNGTNFIDRFGHIGC